MSLCSVVQVLWLHSCWQHPCLNRVAEATIVADCNAQCRLSFLQHHIRIFLRIEKDLLIHLATMEMARRYQVCKEWFRHPVCLPMKPVLPAWLGIFLLQKHIFEKWDTAKLSIFNTPKHREKSKYYSSFCSQVETLKSSDKRPKVGETLRFNWMGCRNPTWTLFLHLHIHAIAVQLL